MKAGKLREGMYVTISKELIDIAINTPGNCPGIKHAKHYNNNFYGIVGEAMTEGLVGITHNMKVYDESGIFIEEYTINHKWLEEIFPEAILDKIEYYLDQLEIKLKKEKQC